MKRKRKAGRIRRPNLGKIWEVTLSPFAIGAELAECQCCSRRTSKKNGDGDEECETKGGSSQKGRIELK